MRNKMFYWISSIYCKFWIKFLFWLRNSLYPSMMFIVEFGDPQGFLMRWQNLWLHLEGHAGHVDQFRFNSEPKYEVRQKSNYSNLFHLRFLFPTKMSNDNESNKASRFVLSMRKNFVLAINIYLKWSLKFQQIWILLTSTSTTPCFWSIFAPWQEKSK